MAEVVAEQVTWLKPLPALGAAVPSGQVAGLTAAVVTAVPNEQLVTVVPVAVVPDVPATQATLAVFTVLPVQEVGNGATVVLHELTFWHSRAVVPVKVAAVQPASLTQAVVEP
jgi:hypothetical protein